MFMTLSRAPNAAAASNGSPFWAWTSGAMSASVIPQMSLVDIGLLPVPYGSYFCIRTGA
jgi:hypothetical protein